MKYLLIKLGLLIFISCAPGPQVQVTTEGQLQSGLDWLRQGIHQIERACPITKIPWGASYDEVIDIFYEARSEIIESSKDNGEITVIKGNAVYHLLLQNGKLFQSMYIIYVPVHLNHFEIYYDIHETITEVLGRADKKGTERGYLSSVWEFNSTNITLLMQPEDNIVSLSSAFMGR